MALFPNTSKLGYFGLNMRNIEIFSFNYHLKKSKQDVKFFILVTKDALLQCHKKYGKWPYLFATIVANTKILLDIAGLVPKFNIRRVFARNKAKLLLFLHLFTFRDKKCNY